MTPVQEEKKSNSLKHTTSFSSKGVTIDAVALVPSGIPEDAALAMIDLIRENQAYHPIHWPAWKRWGIISIYCLLQVFVCLPGTSYVSIEPMIQEKWGGSLQVVTLGQSLFVLGTAIGPVFLGPLSDLGGRKWVYVGSIACYAVLNFGTAYALNLPMLIIFMFLSGIARSTALTNVAGTVADLFGDADNAGHAMGLFVLSGSVGPSVGSPFGQLVGANPNLGMRWLYLFNVIIGFGFALLGCFIPETLPRLVIANAVAENGTTASREILKVSKVRVWQEIRFVATTTFKIMLTEPIILWLGWFNGISYGLLFLYLNTVIQVFSVNNGLSIMSADLTFLNHIVGVLVMVAVTPVQTWLFTRDHKNHGHGRPEARFLMSLGAVWLFPVSLFWFAFTSDGNTSFWSPLVAGAVLSFAEAMIWVSMLNYVTDSYPNVAASAIAAFLIPSYVIAAALSHLGILMIENMTVKWAVATIGFISFGMCALVYILYFYGAKIRKRSTFATAF